LCVISDYDVSCVIVMVRSSGFIMGMVSLHCQHGRHVVMTRSARRFNDSSHALKRQGGHQQPKQKCLEDTVHFKSLSHRKVGSGNCHAYQSKASHGGKLKRKIEIFTANLWQVVFRGTLSILVRVNIVFARMLS
jgi:hypothetical protein